MQPQDLFDRRSSLLQDGSPCWPPVHKRAMVIPLEVLEAIRHVASRTLHSSRVTALDAPKI
jgi:hypothetical protein